MIRVTELKKSFKTGAGELIVLKGINLHVMKGEFLSIVGRSGSGKSTLLYQLGLLDYPNSGTILIDGADISNLTEKERTEFRLTRLGYVFQDYALVPELSAIENVAVPLFMQGLSKVGSYKKAAGALERVGLAERTGHYPSQLSGGEQQRVSIARAIAHEPKILFADEPTANLDNETSLSVINVFLELHKEGQTIVMVTHEPEYAELTNRTVTLFDGLITGEKLNRKS